MGAVNGCDCAAVMGCISAISDTWYARARVKGAQLQPGGLRVSFTSDKYSDSDEAR